MICPHCKVGVAPFFKEHEVRIKLFHDVDNDEGSGYRLDSATCPECDGILVRLSEGLAHRADERGARFQFHYMHNSTLIYPSVVESLRPLPSEIPSDYVSDFRESERVLSISPKASAALSRRLLQKIFHKELDIKEKSLYEEIGKFISTNGTPSYLIEFLDAVRNLGNMAAHPLAEKESGNIVEVEPNDAEWLLDIIEAMYDYVFVQPIRLQAHKDRLNERLRKLGKPEMP